MNLLFLQSLVKELEATLDVASSFASEKMYLHGVCSREDLDFINDLEAKLEKARKLLAKAVAENATACNYEKEEKISFRVGGIIRDLPCFIPLGILVGGLLLASRF